MGKTWSRSMAFLSDSEWSWSAFLVNLLERSGVGVLYQIIKSKPKMTLGWKWRHYLFPKLWKYRSRSMILKKFFESKLN